MTVVRDEAVIWHDAECGGYAEDLVLWRELAEAAPGAVLELGCGTGRVALDLSRQGHAVTAVDSDGALVDALVRRAAERAVGVTARVADVRELDLGERFGLIAAPMQLIQLLDGAGRVAALHAAARHLAAGGTIAAAIVEGVPEGGGELNPLPDVAEIDGWVYSSLPLDIVDEGDEMRVVRLRQIVSPEGDLREELDETRLAVLDADRLEAEARTIGLRPSERRTIPTTDEHVGSTVVVLEGS
jgi:SAM-dependent methyltransferase